MLHSYGRRYSAAAFVVTLVAGTLAVVVPAQQAGAAGPSSGADRVAVDGAGIDKGERAEILGSEYASSDDQVVHAVGDATGLHVMVARERDGYAWTTAATLSEPGVETDRWIGNTCVTPDGRYAAVVYAPRSVTNEPELVQRGGFSAIVDLSNGTTRKLGFGSTLAHYSPGCGAGRRAVFSRYTGLEDEQGAARTRLEVVDATSATVTSSTVEGQLAAAVPTNDGVVAVRGRSIGQVAGSAFRPLATTTSPPHRLVGGEDSVTYLEQDGSGAVARTLSLEGARRTTTLARGPLTELDVVAGGDARPLVVREGAADPRRTTAAVDVTSDDVVATSTEGHAVLVSTRTPTPYKGARGTQVSKEWVEALTTPATQPGDPTPVDLTLMVTRNGTRVSSEVVPGTALADREMTGSSASPWLASGSARSASANAASTTKNTIDADAVCAVPRNDPKTQVYQPTPRQVEWAVNQAVTGNLTLTRSADWKRAGMSSSWSPQGLFPRRALTGGGRVPSPVLLGILAQESNLWQASGHSLSGIPGNPLIGNYYGKDVNDPDDAFSINWAESDCGYGISQVTDGMRKGQQSAHKQRAIAVDYATNIAAGLDILSQKWNETKAAGVVHDDGDPADLEN